MPPVDDYATALADALTVALPRWMRRVAPEADPTPVVEAVMPRIRALLAADIDEQHTTPLAVIREIAVPMLTRALRDAGREPLAPDARDPFLAERFPDDVYGLTPSAWSDIDESLTDPGLAWGAAKAFTHKKRHPR